MERTFGTYVFRSSTKVNVNEFLRKRLLSCAFKIVNYHQTLMEAFTPSPRQRVKTDSNDNLYLFLPTAAMFRSIYRRYYFQRISDTHTGLALMYRICSREVSLEISPFCNSTARHGRYIRQMSRWSPRINGLSCHSFISYARRV